MIQSYLLLSYLEVTNDLWKGHKSPSQKGHKELSGPALLHFLLGNPNLNLYLWLVSWGQDPTYIPFLKLTNCTWKWMLGRQSFPFGARPMFRGELTVTLLECIKEDNLSSTGFGFTLSFLWKIFQHDRLLVIQCGCFDQKVPLWKWVTPFCSGISV